VVVADAFGRAPHGVHPGKKQEDAFNSKRKAKFQSFLLLFLTKSTKHAYQNKIDTNKNKNGYSTLRGFRFAFCFLVFQSSIFKASVKALRSTPI
jgi:hypothetical protein